MTLDDDSECEWPESVPILGQPSHRPIAPLHEPLAKLKPSCKTVSSDEHDDVLDSLEKPVPMSAANPLPMCPRPSCATHWASSLELPMSPRPSGAPLAFLKSFSQTSLPMSPLPMSPLPMSPLLN